MEEHIGSAGSGDTHKGVVPKEEAKDQRKDLEKVMVPHQKEGGDRKQKEEDEKEEE